ncbi:MAG TPA: hypothetical protein VNY75_00300 [Rhizomicrobium sp.]|nr:hypothetical protein [Rhizomicrobium sp.]
MAVLLVVLNLLTPPVPLTKVPILLHVLSACIFAAAILLFPPIWRGERAAKWKWPRIVAAVILAAIGLLTPIQTHAVKLDMPAPSNSR